MQVRPTQLRRILLIVLGLAVCAEASAQTTSQQPTWTPLSAKGTDVGVGANGVLWVIGADPAGAADKSIYEWDGTTLQQKPGAAVRIAVDPNGRAWVVNSTHTIFRWTGSAWQHMPGAALDIGIGANGAVWMIGPDQGIYSWNGSNWQKIDGTGVRIAVDPAGKPWVVNAGDQISRWSGTNWELIPGTAKDVAIAPDGTVFVLSTRPAPGGLQVLRFSDGRWIDETGAAGTSIAAGPAGKVYLTKDAASGAGLLVRGQVPPGGAIAPAPSALAPVAGPAAAPIGDEKQLCWKRSFGRGVGTVPTNCSTGQDKDAGLCYPSCRSAYKGVGPVCWSSCPSDFRDDGAFCAKPAPYGRGGGYPWQFGDAFNDSGMISRCERDNGQGNCEKDGAIYYPKCKANFHKVGCCVCSPDCPSGTTDIGVSCSKDTYGRGVGQIPACTSGLQNDAGLCYGACPRDFDGVGPVCWGKCPAEFPVACGAGCAVSKEACGAAVTDMTLNTVSVAVNLFSFVAGGPGVTAAAKTAAQAGVKAAGKVAAQGGFKTLSSGLQSGMKAYAKDFAKVFLKDYARNQVMDPRNAFSNAFSIASLAGKKGTSLAAANEAAKEMGTLKTESQFDYTLFMSADPTGIASMVYSFAKYAPCTVEDLAANVSEVDFGPGPVTANDVKTVELTVQNPTTITEITTTPLAGCSITPEADCAGKTLQPGQKCTVKVKVAGSAKVIGEVRVYTTVYDIVPFAIGVKANDAASTECQLVPGADEAVNLSSLAGVWAWKNDQSQKFIVNYDGTLQSFRGNGRVAVVDPIKRIYNVTIGADPPAAITLAADHDNFTFPSTGTFAGTSASRRPWDARCNPGETFFVGLCYDIPVGYEPTAPGFMGKPCPSGWRDDGVQCYPPWTGPAVPLQADPDGTLPMQRPILVTDCMKFAQAKGQTCPVHFKNTGGPAGCTCEAQPTSKEVKSIIGKLPH
jgi:hypothetical protein